MRFLYLTICFLLFFPVFESKGQKIVIVNQYADSTGKGDGNGYYIDRVEKHEIIINYYKPADTTDRSRLTELVRGALFFYIDKGFEWQGDHIEPYKSSKKMMKEMDQIVNNGVRFYQFMNDNEFEGFSPSIENQIDEIEKASFKKSPFNIPDPVNSTDAVTRQKYWNYQLGQLKEMIDNELMSFLGQDLYTLDNSSSPLSEEEKRLLIEEINSMGTDEVMQPLAFDFSDGTVTLLASEDEFVLPEYSPSEFQDDFAERVFKLLEENDKKLDHLQNQINDIKEEQQRQWQSQQEAQNASMQGQINDLRELIVSMVNNDEPIRLPESKIPPPPIPNLPEHVDVNFLTGSSGITIVGQYKLNEIVDLLARHDNMKLMITGYADATGNRTANLSLSQKRAKNVKKYIAQSGITEDRLIINYFGDRESKGANPNDRRVAIQFIFR